MKYIDRYFHCGDYLKSALQAVLTELVDVVGAVRWKREFVYQQEGATPKEHQTAYNAAFKDEFSRLGWTDSPALKKDAPKLIGDFQKGLVFVEIQFGNSATLYRDYYKFQYGHANGLLSLAVLIVPEDPLAFFPDRDPRSVGNMANYKLAEQDLSVLPIQVPTLLIGLTPAN